MKPLSEQGNASHSFQLQRLGVVMESEPGTPMEAAGVLNPSSARGRDGQLYLFPRLVARGNYSRIGIAWVRFNEAGDPVGVERLGIALEPEAEYELRPDGGGCEDPRITFIEPLQRHVMTYTAFSSRGPRIALAMSEDLFHWERLGLATFQRYEGVNFNDVANKDALFFPVGIPDPDGQPAMALIHRPLFPGTGPDETRHCRFPRVVNILRESIWISYNSLAKECCDNRRCHHLCYFDSHRRLATPVAAWEQLKIGGGAPPILTPQGWLFLYHGVCEALNKPDSAGKLSYSAGLLVLDEKLLILSAIARQSRSWRRTWPKSAMASCPMLSFRPRLTGGMTWVCRVASMFTMAWLTTASAWRGWICQNICRLRQNRRCHKAPPSHYMMHFKMISMTTAGVEKAEVNRCLLCH